MKIGICLLAFNEVEGLNYFLPILPEICKEYKIDKYFAVDGNSTDGSLELYEKYNVPYFIQDRKGRGEAFKLAFQKSDEDLLIFFSPDGNENIKDLHSFYPLVKEGADIVIASRMMKNAVNEEDRSFFRWRKWANKVFTWFANIIWNRRGTYITDTINGYRAITRTAWEKIKVTSSDYTVEYQTTIHAFKENLQIMEFPTIEGQRIGGESYAKSIPTGIKFTKLLIKELFS